MTYTDITVGILSLLCREITSLRSSRGQFLRKHEGNADVTVLFLVIAIIAGILGFWIIAGLAAWIAKVLFVIFLIFFVLGLISGKKTSVKLR